MWWHIWCSLAPQHLAATLASPIQLAAAWLLDEDCCVVPAGAVAFAIAHS